MPAKKKAVDKGYTTRTNKYKRDPFRPQPDLRINPKSRRHHPVTADSDFCTRRYMRDENNRLIKRCLNSPRKCDLCFRFSQEKLKK